jgi:hypothetical protein
MADLRGPLGRQHGVANVMIFPLRTFIQKIDVCYWAIDCGDLKICSISFLKMPPIFCRRAQPVRRVE